MFNKYNNCSWVDFPKDRLQDILYYYDSKLEPVCRSILNYHKVPKSDWQTLDKRMQFLQDISNLAKNINQNIYHNTYYNKVLVKINEVALSKLNYLKAIKILNHKVEKMYSTVFSQKNLPDNYKPLIINNRRRYNIDTEELWGEYFIECIDPCHRRLINMYLDLWGNKPNIENLADFFLWLEDKNVPLFFPSIYIFTDTELMKLKAKVKDGKILTANNQSISTTFCLSNVYTMNTRGPVFLREHIFIIDRKLNLYLTYSSPEHAHVSMSRYEPLIGAGKITIRNGKIETISFDSGHYLPDIDHVRQSIQVLLSMGVKLSSEIAIRYFNKHEKVAVPLKHLI